MSVASVVVPVALLLLVAGGCLAVGMLIGGQCAVVVTRRREQRLSRERRALNAIWCRLRDQFGIARLPWLEDFLDRPDVFAESAAREASGAAPRCRRCDGKR
jgi:hypothetical protein